jgi:NH3-dependent NAD+ synthetase
VGYHAGIGTHGDAQCEVVLALGSVPLSSVYALGGHSGSLEEIARIQFGQEPTPEEWEDFRTQALNVSLGATWISGKSKDRVLDKTLDAFGILSKTKTEAGA